MNIWYFVLGQPQTPSHKTIFFQSQSNLLGIMVLHDSNGSSLHELNQLNQ